MATVANDTGRRRVRRKQRPLSDDPALNARHATAVELLRKGMETDGPLLLSYVVWPTPAAERSADRAVSSEAEGESAAEVAAPGCGLG